MFTHFAHNTHSREESRTAVRVAAVCGGEFGVEQGCRGDDGSHRPGFYGGIVNGNVILDQNLHLWYIGAQQRTDSSNGRKGLFDV